MDERRADVRERVIYGAVAASGVQGVSRDCVIRNFSEHGAYVEFSRPATLPEDIALTIARKGRSYQARIVWWRDNSAGVAFTAGSPAIAAQPVDLEERLRRSEKKARQLGRRVRELLGES